MSNVATSGGGGALHKDGDPVSVTLGDGEEVTVPADETWVVTITTSYTVDINSNQDVHNGSQTGPLSTVLDAGDTVSDGGGTNSDGTHIGGWSL